MTRKTPPNEPRVFLQALFAVIGALQVTQEAPHPRVSALVRHAERFMESHQEVDWWRTSLQGKPNPAALQLALALAPADLLRSLSRTAMVSLGTAGAA